MINPQIEQVLKRLEKLLQDGTLTPGKHIMEMTMVCFTEQVPNGGVLYHQQPFEALPKDYQIVLRNHKRGDRIAHIKVVGVFDVWAPEASDYPVPSKPIVV